MPLSFTIIATVLRFVAVLGLIACDYCRQI